MISIKNSAGMTSILNLMADNKSKEILTERMIQLSVWEEYDLGQISQFLILTEGDCNADATNELTWSLLENFVDGKVYPEEGFEPSFEFNQYHADAEGPGWWELIYIVGGDFGVTALIHSQIDDQTLLNFCSEFSQDSR